MFDKLHELKERFHYLEEKLSDPEIISDMKQFAQINRDYKELKEIVDLNGEEPIPGVIFPTVQNVAFAVGGKLSYETDDNGVEVIPLPAGMPLLLAGLGGLALLRRRR